MTKKAKTQSEPRKIKGKNGGTLIPGDHGQGKLGGRPKVRPYREAMERVLEELGPKALDDVSKAMLKEAKKGNVQAAKEVRETLDGRGLDINANITSRLSDLDHVSVDDLISLSKEADES